MAQLSYYNDSFIIINILAKHANYSYDFIKHNELCSKNR
jgi:hypothetical protein